MNLIDSSFLTPLLPTVLVDLKFGLIYIAKLLLSSLQTRLLHTINGLPIEQREDTLLVYAVILPITRHLPINAANLPDRLLIDFPERHPFRKVLRFFIILKMVEAS